MTVHVQERRSWPFVEQLFPESRNVSLRRSAVRRLDAKFQYDWIEIEHDEGIDIAVQNAFPDKVLVRKGLDRLPEVIPASAAKP